MTVIEHIWKVLTGRSLRGTVPQYPTHTGYADRWAEANAGPEMEKKLVWWMLAISLLIIACVWGYVVLAGGKLTNR